MGVAMTGQAQTATSGRTDKTMEKAMAAFNQREYGQALPLFEALHKASPQDAPVNYGLGVCQLYAADVARRQQAVAPLETAARLGGAGVPYYVHYHLARAYQLTNRFDEALAQLDAFAARAPKSDPLRKEADGLQRQCRNGAALLAQEVPVVIMNAGPTINSSFTEFSPLINADHTTLIYTATRPTGDARRGEPVTARESIYTAKGALNDWRSPQRIELGNSQQNVGAVALSPDGQHLLLYVGAANGGDLFRAELEGSQWKGPLPLEAPVNSRSRETGASRSADGQELYFASDRPGGHGGLDIWMVQRDARGQWGRPVNLGPDVNTAADEAAPYIHPDGKTLYFHSDGARSMGGLDILKSIRVQGKWQTAQNLGYPINTPFDDAYFVLTPDATKGYFASDRPGGYGSLDIYFLGIPEELNVVPLTMLKGRVLSGEERRPVPTKIRVFDTSTHQPVPNVYTSNAATGNYLIIFPPGKEYEMHLEAEGFQPQRVTIKVPSQRYFYELYQEIILTPIRQFDEVVGQAVSVRNAFHDTGRPVSKVAPDPRFVKEMSLVNDSLDVYELLDNIIAGEDPEAFQYLLELMFATNSTQEVNFDQAPAVEVTAAGFYYEEQKPGQRFTLDARQPHADTPQTQPIFSVDVTKVYFDVNRAELKKDFTNQLDELIEAMRKNPELMVQIAGYADATGDRETNQRLSNQRARAVLKYFNDRGIGRRRILAKGYGQTVQEANYHSDQDKQKDRKVEIRLLSAI